MLAAAIFIISGGHVLFLPLSLCCPSAVFSVIAADTDDGGSPNPLTRVVTAAGRACAETAASEIRSTSAVWPPILAPETMYKASPGRAPNRAKREAVAMVTRRFAKSIWLGEDHVAMGQVDPEEQLEIGPGAFKRLGDCTGSEIESAIRLIAQRRIERAWIAEQAAGPDQGELTIARRFFANTTDAERDLIAYWQMVKLVEDAYVRHMRQGDT